MWPNPQFPANLITFTEEILNGKTSFFVQWIAFLWVSDWILYSCCRLDMRRVIYIYIYISIYIYIYLYLYLYIYISISIYIYIHIIYIYIYIYDKQFTPFWKSNFLYKICRVMWCFKHFHFSLQENLQGIEVKIVGHTKK